MRAQTFLTFSLLTLLPAGALRAQDPAAPVIRVSATGEARGEPDEAWVDLGVETQAPTARAAAEANAAAMQRVIDALVRAGVPRSQVETQGYSVSPEYEGDPEGREPRLRGYRVSNVASAHTLQVASVGALLDAGLAAGANRVNGVRFGVRDADALRTRAVQDAVRRGRAEAQTLATALGVALGPILEASTAFAPVRPYPVVMARQMEMAAAAPTPINPGEQTISATVTLTFRIGS
jgi:uncharacterized protein